MPKVLSPDADDNVFVFWSSHGEPGSLDFGKNQSMDYARMRGIIENTPHRKLLMAVEALLQRWPRRGPRRASLAAYTAGSHVKVYNVPNYGNVYSSSMTEFLFSK